jgi:N-acetylglutamate synthase-like GNAT family acetyltransferase
MSRDELRQAIDEGVIFWGYEEAGELVGVMGLQHLRDVSLIRHAYTRTARQGHDIGERLLFALCAKTSRPTLIGTWRDATWAIRFYENRGFRLAPEEEKDALLRKYWNISESQVRASVVLADRKWFDARNGHKG